MAQTQVSGSGIKNNVITNNHLHSAANIANSKLADSGVTAGSYGSGSATLSLTINAKGIVTAASTNSISTDLVNDSSPQLGGDLDVNSRNINFADSTHNTNNRLVFGTSGDFDIFHDGNSKLENQTGELRYQSDTHVIRSFTTADVHIKSVEGGTVELYWDGGLRASTDNQGLLLPSGKGVCFGDVGCKVSGQAGGGSSVGIFFMTNSSGRWQMTGDGHLLPITAGVVDIGSASKEIGHVFIADNKNIHLGDGQDLKIYHQSSDNNSYIENDTGNLIIRSDAANKDITLQAADILAFNTGGANERMRIDSSGNVGINQIPTRELSVHSPNNNNALIHFTNDDTGETAADGILVGLDGNENMLIANQETGKTIRVLNSGSERMVIDSSGRLGINETAPDTKLHITHSNSTEDVIKLEANPVSASNGDRSKIIFQITQSNGQSARLAEIVSESQGGWGGHLSFNTKPINGSPNDTTDQTLKLNGNGNVQAVRGQMIASHGFLIDDTATSTNQARGIIWSGFDKESTSDSSDSAGIIHTINQEGLTGSVLRIYSNNDDNDGIVLKGGNTTGSYGTRIVNGLKMASGGIRPTTGTSQNGIRWQDDVYGGSGDQAHIQYYQDGSGENTRLRIHIGNDADDDLRLEGNTIRAQGSFSKSSGSFRIPHVLPNLTKTTDLIHSFVESPQADNIYRGKAKLVDGKATINIDTTNNMTDGTFVNLNRDVQCFTTNETGWTLIKGNVTDNILTITAQDNSCTNTISWMVIGERWDLAMYDPKNPMTDANGKVKPEIPNDSYNKGGDYEQDYIYENKYRIGISTISRPEIKNKEIL